MADILDDILIIINGADRLEGISFEEICTTLNQYNESRITAAVAHLHDYRHFIIEVKPGFWAINGDGIAFLDNGGFEAREKKKAEIASLPKKDDKINSQEFLRTVLKVVVTSFIILLIIYFMKGKIAHH